jgi:hypothetical protein
METNNGAHDAAIEAEDRAARDYAERTLKAAERQAAALELGARALARIAQTYPELKDQRARLGFWLMPASIAQRPNQPEKVKDPRTRAAILCAGFAERFADWLLPEAERRAHFEAQKAEREAAEQGAEHPQGGGGY